MGEAFSARSLLRSDDLYPSRVTDAPGMLERQDPVLHGRPDTSPHAPIRAEQVDFFAENGFLLLPGFFSERQVEEAREEMQKLSSSRYIRQRPEAFREAGTGEVRSLFACHRFSERLDRLSRDPRVLDIVCGLLDSDVYLHQSRINYKPGFHGRGFYWHSDFETWHVEDGLPRMRTISCSISLTENTTQNGPLMLIPGSHRTYVQCVGKTPKDHYKKSLVEQQFGTPDDESLGTLAGRRGLQQALGPAGTLLLFECNTMHGSSSNISPLPRSNAFFVYNSVHNTPRAAYGDLEPRPEFIASRGHSEPLRPATS